jgi:hypothetical protein
MSIQPSQTLGEIAAQSAGAIRILEVWTYSLRDKKATVFASAQGARLNQSVFSPDGHWVAYQSLSPDRIYVRPFPPTATVYVAEPGDPDPHHPVWSPDGKELFYTGGPGIFGSMSITTQPGVTFGAAVHVPKQFPFNLAPGSKRSYDMLPDGKGFIGVMSAAASSALSESGSAAAPQIQVVLNWFEDVKQRVP